MPFYEYRRPDGTTFEVMQKMSDPPLAEDPETGVPVTRVFHPIAVHFKGKGFYNTDYGTKNRAREQESQKAAEGGGDKPSTADGAKQAQSSDASKSEPAKSSSKPAKT